MSLQCQNSLMELAGKSLLRAEALAISASQYLPMELSPRLFKQALDSRQTNIMKEMVAAWPFPCLPVGSLIKTPHLETLQALLDGLDMLLTQKLSHSRCELRVLDLRSVHDNFWTIWAGREDDGSSKVIQVRGEKPIHIVKDLPRYSLRRRLKVSADLCLRAHLDEYQACLLQWAQKRRGKLRLCCPKMQIYEVPVHTIRKVLDVFHPEYMEELELNTGWSLSTLARFSSYLGQMINLQKLRIEQIRGSTFKDVNTSTSIEKCVTKFICQFSKLNYLQHLHMNRVFFITDHMEQLSRCLKNPLETLSITYCRLSQLDLNSLSQGQSLCQLKHLDLRGVILFDLCLIHLQDLLEGVVDTLKTLDLEGCRMRDAQVSALLPGLSRCSQLTKVNFYDNVISLSLLEDLLHHTANLSQLTMELYPVPLEFYDDMGKVLIERFQPFFPEFIYKLKAIREPKMISFATDICPQCCNRCAYDQEIRLCLCWQ